MPSMKLAVFVLEMLSREQHTKYESRQSEMNVNLITEKMTCKENDATNRHRERQSKKEIEESIKIK